MDHVILDIEIAKEIGGPEGLTWDDTDKVGVAIAGLYEVDGARMRVYGAAHLKPLMERLLQADRITTFNGFSFDLPVIWGIRRPERVWALEQSSDDLLRRIWQAQGLDPDVFTDRHKGWSLEAVCQGTLGRGKIGHGADAPKWFKAGQIIRVINYCLDDVALTRDLSAFLDREGYVKHPRLGRLEIPPWTPPAWPGQVAQEPQQEELL